MFISIHRMYVTLRINLPHNNNQYWFLESTRKRNLLLLTLQYYFQIHWYSWWLIDNCGGLPTRACGKWLLGYQPTHCMAANKATEAIWLNYLYDVSNSNIFGYSNRNKAHYLTLGHHQVWYFLLSVSNFPKQHFPESYVMNMPPTDFCCIFLNIHIFDIR